ncbi:energy-dependent translational throttle protein EttA, partial [Francisella tularensis subsp. holarctica]|nr:energy-dependent translational throttle protein EttA [Francisella tularensis subsp. holarctica]
DTEIVGEAAPRKGVKVVYLPQEPKLDPTKYVRDNVEEALAHLQDMLTRFDEIIMKFCEPMSDDEMAKLHEEQGELQNAIDAAGAWE